MKVQEKKKKCTKKRFLYRVQVLIWIDFPLYQFVVKLSRLTKLTLLERF